MGKGVAGPLRRGSPGFIVTEVEAVEEETLSMGGKGDKNDDAEDVPSIFSGWTYWSAIKLRRSSLCCSLPLRER